MTRLIVLAAVLPALASGQEAQVDGPVLGYVVQDGSLRAVAGLPGSSLLGPPLDLGIRVERARVSPQQDYVLADAGEAAGVVIARLRGDGVPAPVPDAPAGVERIILSPTGSAAALLYAGSILVIGSLRGTPEVLGSVDLSGLTGPPSAIAVRDDGSMLLLAAADGVYEGRPSGPARFLLGLTGVAAIAYRPEGGAAALAEAATNQLYILTESELIPLAGEREGVSGPVAVAWSSDGRQVILANGEARSIVVVERETGARRLVACDCRPEGLERLEGRAVFRLTGPSSETMWLFDGDAEEPRTVFVAPPAQQ